MFLSAPQCAQHTQVLIDLQLIIADLKSALVVIDYKLDHLKKHRVDVRTVSSATKN